MNDSLALSLGYIARGWAVHPVRAKNKAPASLHGFKDASKDPADAHRWWASGSRLGVAVACGLASGIVVVDVDPRNGGDESERGLDLPITLTSLTGGGGKHYIYRIDGPACSRKGFRPGVDIQADGKYIVVPPSVHASGSVYAWVDPDVEVAAAPTWLVDATRPPAQLPAPLRPATIPRSSDVMSRYRKYIAAMPPAISGSGGHNATFAVARKVASLDWPDALELLEEYNQRCQPPWERWELEHKLKSAKDQGQNVGIKDRPRVEPIRPSVVVPESPDDSWKVNLNWEFCRQTGGERLKKGSDNQIAILRHDPAWKRKIRLNQFSGQIEITDPPWVHVKCPGTSPMGNEDSKLLSQWYQREHLFDVSANDAYEAICVVAKSNAYNPVVEWMDGLKWDGMPRLSRWLTDYLGAEESDYAVLVGRWWLISAVARTYLPGCKADCMLQLEGLEQGKGKSTALNILAGDAWFSDTPFDLNNEQKSGQGIAGVLIYEFGEMASMGRAEIGRIKNYLSSRDDKFRQPWGRVVASHPRRCVFAGTTNHAQSFTDETGNRRFWPVRTAEIALDELRRDREQLWAEAVVAYHSGERWWPADSTERALMSDQQDARLIRDAWEGKITDWLQTQNRPLIDQPQIFQGALGMDAVKWAPQEQRRVGRIMRQLGWEYVRYRDGKAFKWGYRQRGA